MQSFILYFFSVQSVFVICSIKSFEIVWFRLRKFNKLLVTRANVTEVFSLVPARSSAGVTKVLLQWALTTVN